MSLHRYERLGGLVAFFYLKMMNFKDDELTESKSVY